MTTRTFPLIALTLALSLAAGCGKTEPAPQANAEKAAATTTNASVTPTPSREVPSTKPAPPPDPWEMDAAKHVIPEQPVAGRLMKDAFKPEVILLGNILTFQVVDKDNNRTDVEIKLPAKVATDAATGARLRIAKETTPSAEVPEVTVTLPGKANAVQYPHPAGYALSLELTKKDRGQVAGKIYLVLPEMGDRKDENEEKQKNYFAGTFNTQWQRTSEMLPDADDVPYVQGKLVVEGKKDPAVKVGCVGIFPGGIGVESVETSLSGTASSSHLGAAAIIVEPGKTGAGRYELTHLMPGRYFLYAMLPNGPAVGQWLTVEEASKETKDLTIKDGPTGSLEVTVPADTKEKVNLVPANESLTAGVASAIALGLGTGKDSVEGKVKFESLAPGTYEVWTTAKIGSIEVKAGETAKLDTIKK